MPLRISDHWSQARGSAALC